MINGFVGAIDNLPGRPLEWNCSASSSVVRTMPYIHDRPVLLMRPVIAGEGPASTVESARL